MDGIELLVEVRTWLILAGLCFVYTFNVDVT